MIFSEYHKEREDGWFWWHKHNQESNKDEQTNYDLKIVISGKFPELPMSIYVAQCILFDKVCSEFYIP